jgi:hypothetical protein
MTRPITILSLLLLGLAACAGEVLPGRGDDGDDDGDDDGGDVLTCAKGASYVGFGDVDLTADRAAIAVGDERGRLKPYGALAAEYERAIGAIPGELDAQAATFGQSVERWYDEPTASAFTAYAAFRVGLQGCTTLLAGDAAYASAPTEADAATACAAWQHRFWSRTPSSAETAACVDFALDGSQTIADARTRWAYVCASVLSSTGFLTY